MGAGGDGPRNGAWPFGTIRPVVGEPLDNPVEGFDVEAIPPLDPLEERVVIQRIFSDRSSRWASASKSVGQNNELGSKNFFHVRFISGYFRPHQAERSASQFRQRWRIIPPWQTITKT